MIPAYLSPLANHLWQSSLFVAVAGLLVFSLRKHYAPARHWLWLAASVKFLIPFSLLTGLGAQLGWIRPPATIVHRVSIVTEDISRPFVPLDVALSLHPATRPVAADCPRGVGDLRGWAEWAQRRVPARLLGQAR